MSDLIVKVKNNLIKNINTVIILSIIFALFFILGLTFSNVEQIKDVLLNNLLEFYINIFSNKISPISLMLKRILLTLLLFLPIFLLSLNKYTKYLICLFIAYRGFALGIIFKIIAINLLVIGVLIFIISVLIVNLLITFSIILYFVNLNCLQCKDNKLKEILIYLFVSIIIAILSIFIEFLLNICLIRPLLVFFI